MPPKATNSTSNCTHKHSGSRLIAKPKGQSASSSSNSRRKKMSFAVVCTTSKSCQQRGRSTSTNRSCQQQDCSTNSTTTRSSSRRQLHAWALPPAARLIQLMPPCSCSSSWNSSSKTVMRSGSALSKPGWTNRQPSYKGVRCCPGSSWHTMPRCCNANLQCQAPHPQPQ